MDVWMFDLKTVPTDAVLDRVEKNRYDHAIFLTYSLDIPFFERAVLRPLVSRGCNNVVVFGDARQVSSEVLRIVEPTLSFIGWTVGKYYSLTPIHHSFAFHPKVVLLVGESVELFIGSGNLESGGMRGNLEIFHGLKCETDDSTNREASNIVKDLWLYITGQVATRVPRFVRLQLEKVEESVSWITAKHEGVGTSRLVAGPGNDVVPLVAEAVGKDDVEILYILSPFFDANLETLVELKNTLKPKRIVLLLQSATVSVPGERLKNIAGLEAYELGDVGSRYAHAKLVIAECRRSSVMLAGSHNVSSQAFRGKNYEVSILRISGNSERFSDFLGITELAKNSTLIDLSAVEMRFRPETASSDEGAKSLLIGAQLHGDKIEIETRKSLSEEYRLVPYSLGGAGTALDVTPKTSETSLTFCLKNSIIAEEWIAVGVKSETNHTLPVPLLHIEELLEQASSTAKQRIRDRFDHGFSTSLSNIEEILKDLQSFLLQGHRSSVTIKRKAPQSKNVLNKTEVQTLSYEDFIIPLEANDVDSRSSKTARNDFDLLIHAIAHALGGAKEPPAPLIAKGRADLFADQFLAGNADFAREILEKDIELEPQLSQSTGAVPYAPPESETAKKAITGTEKSEKEEPSEAQLKWESSKRLKKMLRMIAAKYPERLASSSNGQGFVPFEILDHVTSAGHLITSMLGRKERYGTERLDLVSWDEWAEFHIELLQVLSNSKDRILQRLPWTNSTFEYYARTLERFVTYLAALQTLCKSPLIEAKARARLSIGLFRVTRILGADRSIEKQKLIEQCVPRFFGSTTAGLPIPKLDWEAWIGFAGKIVQTGAKLRRQFTIAGDIADSGKGARDLEIGDWIWWPHADGHIAVVIEVESSHIEAAYEPLSTKKLAANYVVKLEQ
jgi:hypothetical protein